MASPLQLSAVQNSTRKGKKAKLFICYAFTQRTEEENKLIYADAIQPLGSYWDGNGIGCGLELEEINILLPNILKVQATHPEFLQRVQNFFIDYEVRFDNREASSLELYISLQDDSKPLSESNLPINIDNYLQYRFLRSHPLVASSLDIARYEGKRYVLTDELTEETAKRLKLDIEEKADTLFYGLKEDQAKAKRVALLLGIPVFGKTHTDLLADIKQKKNSDKTTFIRILEDEHLELKAMIKQAEQKGILKVVSSTYFLAEEGTELGIGVDDTIKYLLSKEGKESYSILKARLNNLN